MTSLLDVLKEADLRIGFTKEFQSASSREVIDREELQKRLLFCFYELGTNTGLKRVSASDSAITYDELLHVRRKFIQKDFTFILGDMSLTDCLAREYRSVGAKLRFTGSEGYRSRRYFISRFRRKQEFFRHYFE